MNVHLIFVFNYIIKSNSIFIFSRVLYLIMLYLMRLFSSEINRNINTYFNNTQRFLFILQYLFNFSFFVLIDFKYIVVSKTLIVLEWVEFSRYTTRLNLNQWLWINLKNKILRSIRNIWYSVIIFYTYTLITKKSVLIIILKSTNSHHINCQICNKLTIPIE